MGEEDLRNLVVEFIGKFFLIVLMENSMLVQFKVCYGIIIILGEVYFVYYLVFVGVVSKVNKRLLKQRIFGL